MNVSLIVYSLLEVIFIISAVWRPWDDRSAAVITYFVGQPGSYHHPGSLNIGFCDYCRTEGIDDLTKAYDSYMFCLL